MLNAPEFRRLKRLLTPIDTPASREVICWLERATLDDYNKYLVALAQNKAYAMEEKAYKKEEKAYVREVLACIKTHYPYPQAVNDFLNANIPANTFLPKRLKQLTLDTEKALSAFRDKIRIYCYEYYPIPCEQAWQARVAKEMGVNYVYNKVLHVVKGTVEDVQQWVTGEEVIREEVIKDDNK